jgi:hypothetical protein
MEITINLDIPGIIAAAVTAERIQPLMDKAISEAIKSAIDDATGYRSAFREELKKQLTEAMPHGLHIDDVAKFQLMTNQAVSSAVHGENTKTLQTALQQAIKYVTPDVPDRISLSDLMEAARKGFNKDDHEAFYAYFESSNYGGGWLYLDRNEDCREKYRARNRLGINEDGTVYSLRLDSVDITPKSLPDPIGRFEGLLMSMYVGRTSIEINMDESEVEYAAAAKDD